MIILYFIIKLLLLMDLSINRLKILGEEEIQRLDLKIEEYKNSNQPSILDKSINDIKVQLSDMSNICRDLNNDIISKTKQFELLTKTFNDNQKNYELYSKKIDALEKSIQELETNNSTKETELIEMKQHIEELTKAELKLKEQLLTLNQRNEDYKLKYIEEKEQFEFKIKQLEMEIKQSMSTNFKLYNDFVSDVKNIKINYDIDDVLSIFDKIKIDFMFLLNKKTEYQKKFKDIHKFYYCHIGDGYSRGYTIISQELFLIHKKICSGLVEQATHNPCNLCNFKSFFSLNDKAKSSPSSIGQYYFSEHKSYSYKWLKENYHKILCKLVTHDELLYIINKTDYNKFYKLFLDSNLIDEYENPIEFLLLIAFIGSNGTVLRLY